MFSLSKNFVATVTVASAVLGSTAAHASWHIRPGQLPEVRRIAHVLAGESRQALYEAQRYAGGYNQNEQTAIRALQALANDAHELDREVEAPYLNPDAIDLSYQQVRRNHAAASHGYRYLSAYAYQATLFNNLSQTVAHLRRLRTQNPGQPVHNGLATEAQRLSQNSRVLAQRVALETYNYDGAVRRDAERDTAQLSAVTHRLDQLVRTYGGDPRHTFSEFQVVERAFDQVRQSVPRGSFSLAVSQYLNETSRNLVHIRRYYQNYP